MATILDKIFSDKAAELDGVRAKHPLSEIKSRISELSPVKDVMSLLSQSGKGTRIIAEIKRRSPFAGDLRQDFSALEIAETYAGNGAAAISILTESGYFGGSIEYLENAAKKVDVPLLRKDFIFDPYQVYESRAYGADFFLLIATSLDRNQLEDLRLLGEEVGLTALVETHDEKDMDKAFHAGATLLGVNNRDLTTGKTDLNIARRMLKMTSGVPDLVKVCESGINSREEIEEFEGLGMDAFLIGGSLMKSDNISKKLRELLGNDKAPAAG